MFSVGIALLLLVLQNKLTLAPEICFFASLVFDVFFIVSFRVTRNRKRSNVWFSYIYRAYLTKMFLVNDSVL